MIRLRTVSIQCYSRARLLAWKHTAAVRDFASNTSSQRRNALEQRWKHATAVSKKDVLINDDSQHETVSKRDFSNNVQSSHRYNAAYDEEIYIGCFDLDMRYDWEFDDRFYWVGLSTGIASFCLTVGACHFATFGCLSYSFLIGYYGNILCHELGHAEAARRLGRPVPFIFVHPFGGIAYHELPVNAYEGAVISLSGPVAGFTHAFLCVVGGHVLDSTTLWQVAILGLYLNATNLFPIKFVNGVKTDGYRVLEAVIRKEVSHNEWVKYGYEFPSNFYDLRNEQRLALAAYYGLAVSITPAVIYAFQFVG